MKTKVIVFWGSVVLLGTCGMFAAIGCNKSDPPSSAPVVKEAGATSASNRGTNAPAPTPQPKTETPVDTASIAVTAQEFFEESGKDKKAFAAKYAGRNVEVSGEVYSAAWRDVDNSAMLLLKVKGDVLLCITKDPEPWSKVLPGQKVVLRGVYPKDAFSLHIGKCEIVDPGTYLGIAVPLDKLLQETGENKEETVKKYGKKFLVVESEILAKDEKTVSLTLKGNDKLKIQCEFGLTQKPLVDRLKVGDKIKVVGRYNDGQFDDKLIKFDGCLPITK